MANPASQASVATKNFPARKSLIGVGYNMADILLILNVVFAVLCWKWSMECFEDENRKLIGGVYLIASAWNAASFMATVL